MESEYKVLKIVLDKTRAGDNAAESLRASKVAASKIYIHTRISKVDLMNLTTAEIQAAQYTRLERLVHCVEGLERAVDKLADAILEYGASRVASDGEGVMKVEG